MKLLKYYKSKIFVVVNDKLFIFKAFISPYLVQKKHFLQ